MSSPTNNRPRGAATAPSPDSTHRSGDSRGGYRAATAIGLVTQRELRENLVKKGSVVTLILGMLLAVGGVLLTAYLTRDDGADADPTVIAVVGEAPFAENLAAATAAGADGDGAAEGAADGAAGGAGMGLPGMTRNPIETRPADSEDAARAMLSDGEVDAALVPADGENQWTLLQDGSPDALAGTLNAALSAQLQTQAMVDQGADPAAVAAAAGSGSVTSENAQTVDLAALLVVGAGVMLMITGIMMFGGAVAQSVIEEKSSRVVEIMLATIRPLHLLAGKILGAGIAGAIMLTAIVGAATVTIFITGLAEDFDIPWAAVAMLLPFFLLGYFFFAALYATAGSLVSRMEDFSAAQMPVMLLAFVAIYIPAFGWSNLDSTFMTVAAWVPPASVTTAPLQYAMGGFDGWQLLGSAAILAVTCVLVILLAAYVYPRNVLRTGSRVTWMEALKG
ncbi:ABC transporter permease [uncultured Corynebacterium sp.]|uniref:ABC transporter permease n=1 Tax=uncultured Corynebacterium sp. TaxID=159447 RepID=UPI00262A8B67|nr:ABC transporter permease [uncultured Corynebacterium sp.]